MIILITLSIKDTKRFLKMLKNKKNVKIINSSYDIKIRMKY